MQVLFINEENEMTIPEKLITENIRPALEEFEKVKKVRQKSKTPKKPKKPGFYTHCKESLRRKDGKLRGDFILHKGKDGKKRKIIRRAIYIPPIKGYSIEESQKQTLAYLKKFADNHKAFNWSEIRVVTDKNKFLKISKYKGEEIDTGLFEHDDAIMIYGNVAVHFLNYLLVEPRQNAKAKNAKAKTVPRKQQLPIRRKRTKGVARKSIGGRAPSRKTTPPKTVKKTISKRKRDEDMNEENSSEKEQISNSTGSTTQVLNKLQKNAEGQRSNENEQQANNNNVQTNMTQLIQVQEKPHISEVYQFYSRQHNQQRARINAQSARQMENQNFPSGDGGGFSPEL